MPGVPEQVLKAAEPVAQAMSALHRVETSRGGPGSDAAGALVQVRRALSELQAAPVRHTAADQATEAIASALSLVHQLTAALGQGSVVPSPPTQPSGAFHAAGELPPQVAVVDATRRSAPPNANPPPQVAQNWGQQTAPVGQVWQAPPPAPAAPPAAPAAGGVLRYEAELGAHSSTNFYKGLSGNDVVDSGGIFIATYNIPDVGAPLAVKVSLPGGYEFEAAAIVRWTRDSPQSGPDSSPGFGAQFTQISAEGRQLVYRYVRNREPLFYDDL
jgi:hypothetical protein